MVPSALVGITSLEQKIAKEFGFIFATNKDLFLSKSSLTNPVVFHLQKFYLFKGKVSLEKTKLM